MCEPIREHAEIMHGDPLHFGYDEKDAIKYFLKNMHLMGEIIDRIKIRKHPSEAAEKYFWVENECSTPVEFGGEKASLKKYTNQQSLLDVRAWL